MLVLVNLVFEPMYLLLDIVILYPNLRRLATERLRGGYRIIILKTAFELLLLHFSLHKVATVGVLIVERGGQWPWIYTDEVSDILISLLKLVDWIKLWVPTNLAFFGVSNIFLFLGKKERFIILFVRKSLRTRRGPNHGTMFWTFLIFCAIVIDLLCSTFKVIFQAHLISVLLFENFLLFSGSSSTLLLHLLL